MQEYRTEDLEKELEYLKILAKHFPSIAKASTEIINLLAILKLPKGTEHFLSDIHGEYEAFSHVVRNASGAIRNKIEDVFKNTLLPKERRTLATLIYYPEQKLELIKEQVEDIKEWYRITLFRLVDLCRVFSVNYTRSRVRKMLPDEFSYIIEELLHESRNERNKEIYYNEIIESIIAIDREEEFIIALAELIQKLAITRIHIIGDIYDRGPEAEKIIDMLIKYKSVDIQWGNHDIVWMGAAAGSEACIANAVRIASRYDSLSTIEEGYGINLNPLRYLAMEYYKDDPCIYFKPKFTDESEITDSEKSLTAKMQKAIAIIQQKLEGQIIKAHPEFKMEDRLLLDKIDYAKGTIKIKEKEYKLLDSFFPTVDPSDPYKLNEAEDRVITKLKNSFKNNEKLEKHIQFLFLKGSMYTIFNQNLMYHGCIPTDENGEFQDFYFHNKAFKGKALLDEFDKYARDGYFAKEGTEEKEYGKAILWYLWNGPISPLFGKNEMTTFENYYLEEEELRAEGKNNYYKFRDKEEYAVKIIKEFGLDPSKSHIVNGHVPVKTKKGENPVKANGKLLVIDGGLSKAYQKTTGIAGYTLIYDSKGIQLAAHQPFHSRQKAIEEEQDIVSTRSLLESEITSVEDSDVGKELQAQIEFLKKLLVAYRKGLIKEQK